MGIVWRTTTMPIVCRVLLPGEWTEEGDTCAIQEMAHSSMPQYIADLARRLDDYLEGKECTFSLSHLDLKQCSSFQRNVLLAEFGIPRGHVSTYGKIAAHLGIPGGARAVGNALGANPFPIIIPCHRAVRADGAIGGYRGGVGMKRKLLEIDGVRFGKSGKVLMERIWY